MEGKFVAVFRGIYTVDFQVYDTEPEAQWWVRTQLAIENRYCPCSNPYYAIFFSNEVPYTGKLKGG